MMGDGERRRQGPPCWVLRKAGARVYAQDVRSDWLTQKVLGDSTKKEPASESSPCVYPEGLAGPLPTRDLRRQQRVILSTFSLAKPN